MSIRSKKFLRQAWLAELKEEFFYSDQEDEIYENHDDAVYDSLAQQNLASACQLRTMNLMDFTRPKVKQLRRKKKR